MLEMLSQHARHPLRELREAAGVSQAALAKMTGISTTRISLAENFLGQPLREPEEKALKDAIIRIVEGRWRAISDGTTR